jgi:hypothetical protein
MPLGTIYCMKKMMDERGYYWIPKDSVYKTAWLLVMK